MNILSHFRFYKSHRSGIFFLVLIIIFIQIIQLGRSFFSFSADEVSLGVVASAENEYPYRQFQFNPNYITDFKGYTLGLSVEEIKAIQTYRATGKYIFTLAQFQEISGVSDALLEKIQPYFYFPEKKKLHTETKKEVITLKKQDINTATENDFKKVYGVGDVLATRIVKYRAYLGGFYFNDQITEIYGIPTKTAVEVLKHFEVKAHPKYKKLDVNTCTLNELSKIPYLNKSLAEKIVSYRTKHLKIHSIVELTKIKDFPVDKLNRIELYLTTKS